MVVQDLNANLYQQASLAEFKIAPNDVSPAKKSCLHYFSELLRSF